MKQKKIIAESMPLALKMVRQELGENAIIVNTRTIKTGGVFGLFAKQKFEVTAYSIDKDQDKAAPRFSVEIKEQMKPFLQADQSGKDKSEDELENGSGFHRQPQKLYSYYSKGPDQKENTAHLAQVTHPGQAAQAHAAQTAQVAHIAQQAHPGHEGHAAQAITPVADRENPLLDELQDLRKMMAIMMIDKQKNALPANVAKWVEHLKNQGVDDEVVFHILNHLLRKDASLTFNSDDEIKQEIALIIIDIIRNRNLSESTGEKRPRVINMIGPTGVGKTTTIAKLATEQILKQKRRVAMITTDVYRIAAVEQLKTYAGILNVPIEVVRSSEELSDVLEKLKHYDITYMDTTGRNYKDQSNRESINEFLNHPYESDNYLVLSLTTKFEDLKILLDEFLDSPVQKLILTKFDETSSYGSILNIAYKYPYKLAFITNGQSVPEDIMLIDASLIASFLLGEENEDGSSSKSSRIYASI